VTRVIRHEAPNLKKQWNSISNQSNIKILKDEIKKKILCKRIFLKKTWQLKEWGSKLKPNKFYIWLKGKIEMKTNLVKE
jgi:hypothetical protein